MKKKLLIILVLISGIFLITSCKDNKDEDKLKIVTTIFPQYSFTKEIVGNLCDVDVVLKPGQDSHNFDPSISTVFSINKADMFIYTGEHMETWANKIISNIKEDGPAVVEAAKGIEFEIVEEDQDEHAGDSGDHKHNYDPHVWTSITYSMQMVQTISSAICAIDPDNAEIYKENTKNYLSKLTALDQEFKDLVKQAVNKTLYFVSPFSFYYFVKEYGLEYVSLYNTCSTEVEPSATDIIKMINLIKEQKVKYIYKKELMSDDVPNTIAKETKTTVQVLHSGHNVSVDDFQKNITYLDIMKKNLEVLKKGLL